MDKLEEIFRLQKMFNDDLGEARGLDNTDTETWIQRLTLAMLSEMAELLDEVNFKWWKNKKELDPALAKGEVVDILHFFVSMCLRLNMDAQELYDLYVEKNRENFLRQQGKSDKSGYTLPGTDAQL